jgi:hypothetical protein
MHNLTSEGQRLLEEIGRRNGFSTEAMLALLQSVRSGRGTMAQFSHPELGGMGQWTRGGMIMIGDMFNNALKSRIAALCAELSEVVGRTDVVSRRPASSQWQSQGGSGGMPLPESSLFVPAPGGFGASNWWPSDLGNPGSTGAQNNMRYAYFPGGRRLAIEVNGRMSVHDTGDHAINGFAQQQSGDQSLTFTSQYGVVRLDSLPLVSGADAPMPPPAAEPRPFGPGSGADTPMARPEPPSSGGPDAGTRPAGGDIFHSLERLAGLRDKGIISEQEFSEKKAELLKRL